MSTDVITDASTTEKFDFDSIKTNLDNLEEYYNNYYEALNNLDLTISTLLNVSPSSGIYGDLGGKLYSAWSTKCAPLKNYYYLFREWSSLITEAWQKYADFTAAASGIYGASAIQTLYGDGQVDGQVEYDSNEVENARTIAALEGGQLTIDGEPIPTTRKGKDSFTVKVDGKEYTVTKDKNGNVSSVTNPDGEEVYSRKEYSKDTGVTSIDDARSALDNHDLGDAKSTSTIDISGIDSPNPDTTSSNDDAWIQAGEELVSQSKAVRDSMGERNDSIMEYVSTISDDPNFQKLSDTEQREILSKLSDYANQYSEIYYTLDGDLDEGWAVTGWFDGSIHYASRGKVLSSDEAAYNDAKAEIENVNSQISQLPSESAIDEWLASYGLSGISGYGN